MWRGWRFHFGTLGAILAAWGHPGGPSEQQEGQVGVHKYMCVDFAVIWGPHFERFLFSEEFDFVFRSLFRIELLIEILALRGPRTKLTYVMYYKSVFLFLQNPCFDD